MLKEPRWGFPELITVYVGTMLIVGLLSGAVRAALSVIDYFLITYSIQVLVQIGMVYLFAVLLCRGKWSDVGLKNASANDYLKYGLAGGLSLFIIIYVISLPLAFWQPELEPQYYEQVLRSAGGYGEFIMIFLMGAVFGPLSEELFYRGMVYPVCKKYLGFTGGAIVAGLIFGIAHMSLWRTIPLAVGGTVLCYLYEKSDSILVPVVAHGLWNGIMSIIVYSTIV